MYAQNIDIAEKSAQITAEAQVKKEFTSSTAFSYRVVIEDVSRETVKEVNGTQYILQAGETRTISASDNITNLQLRSWKYGYLYIVRTILSMDGKPVNTVTTPKGSRKTSFTKGMFKLNDRTLHLKAYAQRTTIEWVALSSAVSAWLTDFSNQLVLNFHANLICWMDVTP